MLQLHELDEFHLQAYESARFCKENTKRLHEKNIVDKHLK